MPLQETCPKKLSRGWRRRLRCFPRRWLWLTMLGTLACGAPARSRRTEARPHPPSSLLPVEAYAGEFEWRQRITASWGEKSSSFDAVLQKTKGELKLIGLGPMQSVVFEVRYTGRRVTLDNRSGRAFPFPPKFIVADIQRAFYPWLGPLPSCAICERSAQVLGWRVAERIASGQVRERRFHAPASRSDEDVVILYRYRSAASRVPSRAALKNPRYGYHLIIENNVHDSGNARSAAAAGQVLGLRALYLSRTSSVPTLRRSK